jgi:hypothetical protein
MIYERPAPGAPITQGDIIANCPLVYSEIDEAATDQRDVRYVNSLEDVVVLTQACDLANMKRKHVQVAIVHAAQTLVDKGVLKTQTVRDQIRRHKEFGRYFLPADDELSLPESIVDLLDVHTVPRRLLELLVHEGHRRATLSTPYREHLAQHFAVTFSRIALPEPYPTQADS